MTITLQHPFLTRCYNLTELLTNCHLLSTFCGRLEKQSKLFPDRIRPDKYKGDGFELLIEALLKLSPVDNRLGIFNYQPADERSDKGIDGRGLGIDGKLATIQIKYRSNHDQLLTTNNDHLSNFVMSSLFEGVEKDSCKNMLIITTAKGLHHFTDKEMFESKVRCIGQDDLRHLIDNNLNFWNAFRQLCNIQ